MKTAEFQQQMKQRNAIEGTHSELIRAHGLRRARYRGVKKVTLQNSLIGAALQRQTLDPTPAMGNETRDTAGAKPPASQLERPQRKRNREHTRLL